MKINRTIINVICSMAVLMTNLIISFVLSPYIVENIGVEANGFVTLANNFVMYAQLIVSALNSMAARYITMAYVKEDYKRANLYYNSVFWGNLIIVVTLIGPATYMIFKLETLINIPNNILTDVKLLFAFIFLNFFVTTGAPNYDCGTYVSNRLSRTYIPQMATSILKCFLLFILFTVFVPHVWYVGLATSVVTILLLIINRFNTHKLTPELKVFVKKGKRIYSTNAMKELVGAGIWNSISSVGNMLLSGLDLVICNITLGATSMGIVSLSKILPNYIQQFSASIRNAFAPELVINYAKGDMDAVLKDLKRAMKLTSVVMTVPIAGIIILGDCFFMLWVPTQNAQLLQTLSILAIFGYMFTSGTQILFNVFTTVNKVKQNAIAMLISGMLSTCIVIFCVRYTEYGIYAVAGVSSIVNLTRNMVYTLPATAKYLGFKWYQFFPMVGITVISSVLIIGLGVVIKPYLPRGTWFSLFVSAIVVCIMGVLINVMLVLNREERKYLFDKISKKVKG